MFKKCFSTLGCPEFTLDQTLKLARATQCPFIEIRALENEIDLPKYFREQGITPERLATDCADQSVQISAFNTSLKISSSEDEWIDTIDDLAPWIIAANVPSLRVFDGAAENGWPAWLVTAQEKAEFWQTLKSERRWHFNLIIETHDTLLQSDQIKAFAHSTSNAFPILWDAHHTWRKGGEDWGATWQQCKSLIHHVHIKDSIDTPSARHSFTYTALNAGQMQPQKLMQLLLDEGYTGILSLEWERMWHPYLAPLPIALMDFNACLSKLSAPT